LSGSCDDLPLDVVALLRDRVPGPSDLEMLLLVRSDATRGWTVPEVSHAIGLPESWARDSLGSLCMVALVVADESGDEPRFFYHPATPALEASIATLARVYAEQPAEIIRRLNDNAITRVRLAAVQAFPFALLLRAAAG
jgi:hypothetical protein